MHRFNSITTAILVILSALSFSALAAGPEIPQGKGEHCVEPVDVMRRDHYEFILHQRDETVHKGIRSSKYSLVECINCHVLPDEDKQFVSHESPEHFCSSCHTFASVKIDCFECHSDKPVSSEADKMHGSGDGQKPVDLKKPSKSLNASLIASSLKNLKANP